MDNGFGRIVNPLPPMGKPRPLSRPPTVDAPSESSADKGAASKGATRIFRNRVSVCAVCPIDIVFRVFTSTPDGHQEHETASDVVLQIGAEPMSAFMSRLLGQDQSFVLNSVFRSDSSRVQVTPGSTAQWVTNPGSVATVSRAASCAKV